LADSDAIEILLVEVNPSDAEVTLHALRKNNPANHAQIVRDGEEARNLLFCRGAFSSRQFDAAPRLVPLDPKLPKRDGLQVLQEVKGDPRTMSIPIIVPTSSKEERDLMKSYKLGVNSYIQKPVNFGEFQNVVGQLGMYWLLVNSKPPAAAFLAR
jgi:two-component system, response regulator